MSRRHIDADQIEWVDVAAGFHRCDITLDQGETAWNPASTKRLIYGPARVVYEQGPQGDVTAYVEDVIAPGTLVEFTTGPLGVIEPGGGRFTDEFVVEGGTGFYVGPHDSIPGWDMIGTHINGRLYHVPVGHTQFKVAADG